MVVLIQVLEKVEVNVNRLDQRVLLKGCEPSKMKQTRMWIVDNSVDNQYAKMQLEEAASFLKQDEVVAFPTETVYGLGANAFSTAAVEKIFQAKGRPTDNPLIIHIADQALLDQVALEIPEAAQQLMDKFWPGPLTLVLPKKGPLSPLVTAGLDTVGIRMPDHPVALELIRLAGVPLAAPSANRSGKPSPTTGQHVKVDLEGRIAGIVEAGPTGIGVESTVVDCTTTPVTILRPGGVTYEQLRAVLGEVNMDPGLNNEQIAPKSPGVKYTHYAPNAPLFLLESPEALVHQLHKQKSAGKKVGVLTVDEHQALFKEADVRISCGSMKDLFSVAQSLYAALRQFDEREVDLILGEMFPETGIGGAVMNRLRKASGGRVLKADSPV